VALIYDDESTATIELLLLESSAQLHSFMCYHYFQ
jgi:hypothetical protein